MVARIRRKQKIVPPLEIKTSEQFKGLLKEGVRLGYNPAEFLELIDIASDVIYAALREKRRKLRDVAGLAGIDIADSIESRITANANLNGHNGGLGIRNFLISGDILYGINEAVKDIPGYKPTSQILTELPPDVVTSHDFVIYLASTYLSRAYYRRRATSTADQHA